MALGADTSTDYAKYIKATCFAVRVTTDVLNCTRPYQMDLDLSPAPPSTLTHTTSTTGAPETPSKGVTPTI